MSCWLSQYTACFWYGNPQKLCRQPRQGRVEGKERTVYGIQTSNATHIADAVIRDLTASRNRSRLTEFDAQIRCDVANGAHQALWSRKSLDGEQITHSIVGPAQLGSCGVCSSIGNKRFAVLRTGGSGSDGNRQYREQKTRSDRCVMGQE